MMQKTNINWCDYTWNPIVGCTPCSPGCANCYAKALHDKRHAAYLAGKKLPAQYAKPFSQIQFFPERLRDPVKRKKPATIFVCSMGDLFHESVRFEMIDQVMAAVALTPRHTFMLLTKRPDRMAEYWKQFDKNRVWLQLGKIIGDDPFHKAGLPVLPHKGAEDSDWWDEEDDPLPNLWFGVTVCNQQEADTKIPLLLQTPAARRFISIEPMLGPVDLKRLPCVDGYGYGWANPLDGIHPALNPRRPALDLVIVGGETGKKARPMHPDWVRSVRDQCQRGGVPFHFKGWGEWAEASQVGYSGSRAATGGKTEFYEPAAGKWMPPLKVKYSIPENHPTAIGVYRLGSRRSGRLLDGREHNGAEEVR